MVVQLTTGAIDLGIMTANPEPMVAFYRDVLGFTQEPDTPFPGKGGGTMHRLRAGETLLKIIEPGETPEAKAAPGGPLGGLGLRYFTFAVENADDIATACTDAGHRVRMGPVELRPGVKVMFVEDPDGNWVEFVERKG